jgi:hypothetical protein
MPDLSRHPVFSTPSEDGPVKKRLVVSLDSRPRELHDQYGPVTILPWREFLTQLWSGTLLA